MWIKYQNNFKYRRRIIVNRNFPTTFSKFVHKIYSIWNEWIIGSDHLRRHHIQSHSDGQFINWKLIQVAINYTRENIPLANLMNWFFFSHLESFCCMRLDSFWIGLMAMSLIMTSHHGLYIMADDRLASIFFAFANQSIMAVNHYEVLHIWCNFRNIIETHVMHLITRNYSHHFPLAHILIDEETSTSVLCNHVICVCMCSRSRCWIDSEKFAINQSSWGMLPVSNV